MNHLTKAWIIWQHFTTWLSSHVPTSYGTMWHSPMVPCGTQVAMSSVTYPTPSASKNKKFQQSPNPTKFDWVARFRETFPMVMSVSSSEIKENPRFSTCTIATIYRFALFQRKCIYLFILGFTRPRAKNGPSHFDPFFQADF